MAHTSSKEKSSAREKTLGRILTLSGVVGEPIWKELADEAEVYLELYECLSQEPLDSSDREALEDKMILSLAHLSVHSQVLYDSIDEAIETNIVEEFKHKNYLQETFTEATEVEMHKSLEVGASAQEAIVNFWNYLNELTVKHGEEIESKNLELKKVTASQSSKAKKSKGINRVLNGTASLVERYTDNISAKLPEYRYDVGKYIEAYAKFAFWLGSLDRDEEAQKQELFEASNDFRKTLKELVSSMSEFIINIQGLGHTALEDLNHTRLSDACANLVKKLVGTLDTVRELDTFTEGILEKLSARD